MADARSWTLIRRGFRFAEPDAEADYRRAQQRRGLQALRLAGPVIGLLCLGIWGLQHAIDGGPVSAAMRQVLAVATIVFTVLALLARAADPARQPLLAVLFAAACASLASIAGPAVLAAHGSLELLLRYGDLGPVLLAMVPYLLLRLPALTGLVINLGSAAAYGAVVCAVPDFPAVDRLLHLQNVAAGLMIATAGGGLLELLERRSHAQQRLLEAREQELAQAHAEVQRLLLNVLPDEIATRLQRGEAPIADHAPAVTVVFADLVGFTPLAARLTPAALVDLLDTVFRRVDALAALHGLEKIKTIGDAYLAVAGLPRPDPAHVEHACRFALDLRDAVDQIARETGHALAIRVGIHSGSVVAGVIGSRKFSYDLWGETVNIAARLESQGAPGRIQIGATTAAQLPADLRADPRGDIELKGVGVCRTYWLGTTPPDTSIP